MGPMRGTAIPIQTSAQWPQEGVSRERGQNCTFCGDAPASKQLAPRPDSAGHLLDQAAEVTVAADADDILVGAWVCEKAMSAIRA